VVVERVERIPLVKRQQTCGEHRRGGWADPGVPNAVLPLCPQVPVPGRPVVAGVRGDDGTPQWGAIVPVTRQDAREE
jgi:hypothetical protein